MKIFLSILQLAGSLAFLLYGMNMMSDGIQKSAGTKLQKALGFMTGNRILGFITGLILTMIIQSSGATTVMEVSFVNAGLMTLQQSVAVTFGANIGTTVTAWIVALFGFNFKIKNFAIPIFGLGFVLTQIKKWNKKGVGEAIMGFGLLFIGLDWLSSAIGPENGALNFLAKCGDWGFLSTLIGVAVGAIITALIHSSSAETAIVITMAYNNLLTWEFAAALVIGSNIGSTIDAIMAAWSGPVDGKRTALVHLLFNLATVIIAVAFLTPLLDLIDIMVPGTPQEAITLHIAMLHTVVKTITSLVCLPFTKQIAALVTKLIKPSKQEQNSKYVLEFTEAASGKENAVPYILRVEKEIGVMTELVVKMFEEIHSGFKNRTSSFISENMENLTLQEDYADQMKEQLTKYIVHIGKLPLSDQQTEQLSAMQQIIDDLEEMTDDLINVGLLLKKSIEKDMQFAQEDMDRLNPYVDLARQSMDFIKTRINTHIDEADFLIAREIETQIDVFKKNLKKVARKRLESGSDVKAELLYIDLVRQVEKFGDRAYNISEVLAHKQK